MERLKYFFSNMWDLIRIGRLRTTREKLEAIARKHGYSGIEVMPKKKKYKTGNPYKKVRRVPEY